MEESETKGQCANSAKTKKDCLYGHEIDERLESTAEKFKGLWKETKEQRNKDQRRSLVLTLI